MDRSRIDGMIMEQEGLSQLHRSDIEAMQLQKLNGVLKREQERGGFYAKLPKQLHSLKELSELPFTTPEALQLHGGRMLLCSQNEVQRIITDRTSGTTGLPKRLFYTKEDLERTVLLFMAGLGEFIGPGSRTMICMPFSGPYGLGELIAEAVERLGAAPLKTGPFLSYGEYAAILERERPDTFVGMPVQLLAILRFCGAGSLKRALVSGDACPETVLTECERLLGTRLFPHYGSREMALGGAVTCPAHEGMHLRENHVIAEIIDADGKVLPAGQCGELVITTIGMTAQPLIRYRTGDYTRILGGVCPCGSETLRLGRVSRKAEEGLPSIEALDNLIFACPEIVDYRAAYEEPFSDGTGKKISAAYGENSGVGGSAAADEKRSGRDNSATADGKRSGMGSSTAAYEEPAGVGGSAAASEKLPAGRDSCERRGRLHLELLVKKTGQTKRLCSMLQETYGNLEVRVTERVCSKEAKAMYMGKRTVERRLAEDGQ